IALSIYEPLTHLNHANKSSREWQDHYADLEKILAKTTEVYGFSNIYVNESFRRNYLFVISKKHRGGLIYLTGTTLLLLPRESNTGQIYFTQMYISRP
ncbi:MAG: hypothetical protein LRY71_16975, partial [Bacillaceae bacterium]|nr:hypothetical protein [Bacillaceae bacterium]